MSYEIPAFSSAPHAPDTKRFVVTVSDEETASGLSVSARPMRSESDVVHTLGAIFMLAATAVVILTGFGCTAGGAPPPGRDAGVMANPDGGDRMPCAAGDTHRCEGNVAVSCGSGGAETRTDCAASGQTCTPGAGCRACAPGRFRCTGDQLERCNTEGTGFVSDVVCASASGESCDPLLGACVNLCAQAEASNSYIGCDYWPTPLANQVAAEFDFAVVVSNPQAVPAEVRVERGGSEIARATVPPGGLETIRLPWVPALKNPGRPDGFDEGLMLPASAMVRGGAYHLTSSVPVTAHQFNPLEYSLPRDCASEPAGALPDGQCFSFSNDASLLLPTHVMTGNYIAASRPTLHRRITAASAFGGMPVQVSANPSSPNELFTSTPGFVAIVGVGESPVSVSVRFTAHVAASMDGTVRSFAPGETGEFSLNPGDVLQIASDAPTRCAGGSPSDDQMSNCGGGIFPTPCTVTHTYCAAETDYDLTGTVVTATGPVQVFGGHECAFVPEHRWACDHLEESLFPLETWGRQFLVAAPRPLRGEPNMVRLVSGADGNAITFEPSIHAPVTLARGEFLEFEQREDVRIEASGALMVVQYLVGQDFGGLGSSGMMGQGDPAMSLAIPTEQFRSQYTLLAPSTFETSYLGITAMVGQEVMLDGVAVSGWRPLGTTGYQTTQVQITGGSHQLTGPSPFGAVVYGFGSYTSYMYPGGLDLEEINPLI